MQLSVISLAPYHPGNSQVLGGTYPGIYRILCPCKPRPYPRLMQGDISSKGPEIIYPGMSAYARTCD